MSHRSYKYRLYPTANQERELGVMLETHRRLYNAALEQRIYAWRNMRRSVSFFDQSAELPDLRASNEWLKKTNAHSCRGTLLRLDRAFKRFFERAKLGDHSGFPRFKGRDHFASVEFQGGSSGSGAKLIDRRLRVQHVGTIKVKLHRPVEGVIKTVTLKREADRWYVIFACEIEAVAVAASTLPNSGIDLGLESFLTDSDGMHEPNPRFLKRELPALRRAQRAVSRKKRGGANRRKAQRAVAALHRKVKDQRREHRYQVADRLVRRYGLIGVEGLTVKNMVRSRSFARAISDAGWGLFVSTLKHKAQKAGAAVVEVDPRGTSQECSGCGAVVPKDLGVRWHSCPTCGLSIHRDHNAARNVLARARLARTGPVEANGAAGRRPPRSRGRKVEESSQERLVRYG